MTDSEREALAERMERLAADVSYAFMGVTMALVRRQPYDVDASRFVSGKAEAFSDGLLDFARRIREDDFAPAKVYH